MMEVANAAGAVACHISPELYFRRKSGFPAAARVLSPREPCFFTSSSRRWWPVIGLGSRELPSLLLRSPPRLSQSGEGLTSKMAESEGTDVCSSGDMIFEAILEDGVFRFDCSISDRAAAFPSLSFTDPKIREAPVKSFRLPRFVPTFESKLGKQTVTIQLPTGSSFYGTGEVSGPLERTGRRIFTWNTDAWGYGSGTTSLYQSHPWVLALLPDGKALGVLADTTRRCEVDLREDSTIKFAASSAYPVIIFGPFETPTEILMSLSRAIVEEETRQGRGSEPDGTTNARAHHTQGQHMLAISHLRVP